MSVNRDSGQFPDNVQLTPLPAFDDNYIWCMHNEKNCVVVDPGDADVVIAFCNQHKLTPIAVLITHHHADHTGGLPKLRQHFEGVEVYGPTNTNIRLITSRLVEEQSITIDAMELSFDIIELPGHTLDHIAFIGHGGVFCGDTLFSAGCGRLFEGTPAQMMNSLGKLSSLPDDTQVWCTHEYTLANLAFANTVDESNKELQRYTDWAKKTRAKGLPTLPSDIKTQKAINPFLRANTMDVKRSSEAYTGKALDDELAVFTEVRRWKDNF